MKKNLCDLFKEMNPLKISNGDYYNVVAFCDILNQLEETDIYVNEHIITPFYIYNNKVLELYDYSLNIQQVDSPNFNNFILEETGKTKLNEINNSIIQKYEKCYLETIRPNKYLPIAKLQEYLHYLRTVTDIKDRIFDYLNEFYEDKLYIELY
ncbi:MAG: hypothetical protein FWG87_03520 [Defluviitaleaceae bacterium]|nr:hypothetical protein [Defluviitaleaceae bacterium]